MLGTFEALAEFGEEKKPEQTNDLDEVASVDISAIINRIADLEKKVSELTTDKKFEIETAPTEAEETTEEEKEN